MTILIFFVVIWYASLFCQSFFLHRYAAHGAFEMSKFWVWFFSILTYITQGSSYMSPRAYAIMHRMHHAYTDTEKDPHSPTYSKNLFAMMGRTMKIFNDIYYERMEIETRFLKNAPESNWFDRWASSTTSKVIWAAAYLAFFIIFATSFGGIYYFRSLF